MQQRSEETRAHILEAAYILFSRFGYEATSVSEICQAAGVSKGAFYHHFPAKQSLFMALLESWLAKLDAGFLVNRQQAKNIPQAFLDMAATASQVVKSAQVDLSILLEFWTVASRDPDVWEATIAPYSRYQVYFADLIREGIAEGSLQPVDANLAARVLVSFALGILMQAVFDRQHFDWSDEVEQGMQILLTGLRRKV